MKRNATEKKKVQRLDIEWTQNEDFLYQQFVSLWDMTGCCLCGFIFEDERNFFEFHSYICAMYVYYMHNLFIKLQGKMGERKLLEKSTKMKRSVQKIHYNNFPSCR